MLAASTWIARLFMQLGPVCRAQALAVWSCASGQCDLVCDWLCTQRLHASLHGAWPQHAPTLAAGQAVVLKPRLVLLPVRNARRQLLGVLLFAGDHPQHGARRALLDDLVGKLGLALADPLPPPSPELLTLCMDRLDAPGGHKEVERQFYGVLLTRHGGNVARAARALGLPRQSLRNRLQRLHVKAPRARALRALPRSAPLSGEALELEQRACRDVLQRCQGDTRLAAIVLRLTPVALQSYLRRLGIAAPTPTRQTPRRRQA